VSVLVSVGHGLALFVAALLVLVFAKLALEWALRLPIDEALFEADNPAVALVAGGYYAGVAAVLWAALRGQEATWVADLASTAHYGAWGTVLLALATRFAGPVLLPGFHVADELVRDRNAGTGVAVGAALLASGLIVAGAMQGQAPGGLVIGLASTTGAFLLGQGSLAVLTRVYGRFVGFDAHAEIERDNVAAGCALAGGLVGNGILLAWGVSGDLDPKRLVASVGPVALAVVLGVLLLPVLRLLVTRVFFAGIPFATVIADFPDPDTEAVARLYSTAFYHSVAARPAPGGLLVTQSSSPFYAPGAFLCVARTLEAAGFVVRSYTADVPSFGPWGFHLAARGAPPDVTGLRLRVRTRFLTDAHARAMFDLPRDLSPSAEVRPNRLMDPVLVRYHNDPRWAAYR
jgi:uncharacterized membrane protein YjfL (UPF0719 family)